MQLTQSQRYEIAKQLNENSKHLIVNGIEYVLIAKKAILTMQDDLDELSNELYENTGA